jgi:hypothetical protein
MARSMSDYPERVYSSSEEGKQRHLTGRGGSGGLPSGWLLVGLAGIGLAAYMVWHFGPDFARCVKMERM